MRKIGGEKVKNTTSVHTTTIITTILIVEEEITTLVFTVVVKLNHSGHDATDAHNINTQVLLSMKVILT